MTIEEAKNVLAGCRGQIDEIDRQLVRLINDRVRVVERIGAVKKEVAMPVYEPKREEEVYRNIETSNEGPLPNDAARRIFERIIDEMRTLQRTRMGAK
ncbi:MAG: chorismate mutase [Acidobacteria bacterium]|nr:chorismate mutase [Acidobacteriota bacterium]